MRPGTMKKIRLRQSNLLKEILLLQNQVKIHWLIHSPAREISPRVKNDPENIRFNPVARSSNGYAPGPGVLVLILKI